MDRDSIRYFALRARTSLVEQITKKAAELGIIKVTADGLDRMVEDVACSWFNRLTCLRYMETNGFLPSGIPGLYFLVKNRSLCKELLIRQCQLLAGIFPFIFEDSYGYEQLLLPEGLFGDDGLIANVVSSINQRDFVDNPQILGWLYQHFISPKKDEVFAGLKQNKKISKNDIPAATQLFTPDWIAKYMVENSLGRLWLDCTNDGRLRRQWLYYIDDGDEGSGKDRRYGETSETYKLNPEQIKVLDPAVGSGNILVHAFDVLYGIYLSAGYEKGSIPQLILEKNLYGLDIDERATGLACFVLMMKARSKDRDLFGRDIRLNLYSVQQSNGLAYEDVVSMFRSEGSGQIYNGLYRDIKELLDAFYDAAEYGSVIKLPDMDLKRLKKVCDKQSNGKSRVLDKLLSLIKQAEVMKTKYHVVVTNPPYMGIRGMNQKLASYLNVHYRYSKHDFFTVFMELAKTMTMPGGYLSLINQHSWMFLSSYRDFRQAFLRDCCICNMLHLGSNAFERGNSIGTIVQTTAFVAKKELVKGHRSVFIDLCSFASSEAKRVALLDLIREGGRGNKYKVCISDLKGIPGEPVAYWADSDLIRAFIDNKKLGELALPRQGMATSDNNRFVRHWYEVKYDDIGRGYGSTHQAKKSGYKWFPYNKGGAYRKWYGNNRFVVNWQNDGQEIKELASSLYSSYTRTIKNIEFYFREAITYTFISDSMGARYSPRGAIFDVAGSSIFLPKKELLFVLAFLCSKLSKEFLYILNPTFNIQVGDIKNLPLPSIKDGRLKARIACLAEQNIEIAKEDWDCCEISMDFKIHPLLIHREGASTMQQAFNNWSRYAHRQFQRIKTNEEELNEIFIETFGLQHRVQPEVSNDDITLNGANRTRDIKSFISYAVGCMFGRYSCNHEGVIDTGNSIIPVTGAEHFQDNILNRFTVFVKALFGEHTLEQNLEYIAESLGKRTGETAEQTIGRYFLRDFYKDHVKMYNRRPIYWLFDTGRQNAFKGLVYMHSYNSSVLHLLKNEYIDRIQDIYEQHLESLEKEMTVEKSAAQIGKAIRRRELLEKRLVECAIYQRALSQVIGREPQIDFDDGVKTNYAKFQNISIRDKWGAVRVNLLAKI